MKIGSQSRSFLPGNDLDVGDAPSGAFNRAVAPRSDDQKENFRTSARSIQNRAESLREVDAPGVHGDGTLLRKGELLARLLSTEARAHIVWGEPVVSDRNLAFGDAEPPVTLGGVIRVKQYAHDA